MQLAIDLFFFHCNCEIFIILLSYILYIQTITTAWGIKKQMQSHDHMIFFKMWCARTLESNIVAIC